MASTPYPLPRQSRESSILVGNGTVGPYGPTIFKVFDILDLEVLAKATGEDVFSTVDPADYTVAKTADLAFDTVSVTFDASVPNTTSFVIRAARVAERSVAVTRAGAIDGDQLEKELSKIASVLSELRRDVGRAVKADPDASAAIRIGAGAEDKLVAYDADGNLVDSGKTLAELQIEAGAGDVVGAASSTNNGFVRWNGTSGKLLADGAATIATADIGDAQVTPAKLDNGAAVSVLGRSANSSGARADIAAGADDRALVRTGGALSFAQLTYAMIAAAALATNADMMSGTASKLLSAAILKSAVAYQPLTDGANIAWDMVSGNNAQVVLDGNRTLSNMSNPTPQFGFVLKVTATTSTRTLALSANYIVAAGVEAFPISVTTAETVYIIGFVDTAGRQIITGVIRT